MGVKRFGAGTLALIVCASLLLSTGGSTRTAAAGAAFVVVVAVPRLSRRSVPIEKPRLKDRLIKQRAAINIRHKNSSSSSSRLKASNIPPNREDPLMSFVEQSRISRRDVFGYDDWVDHRSTDRFIGNLLNTMNSVIFKTLVPEILRYTFVAVSVCAYNGLLVAGYEDLAGVHREALAPFFPVCRLPPDFFSLTTPSLALLLVFKTNTSYRRWDEGRKAWGAIVNSTRSILREAAAWLHEVDGLTNEQKQRLMERLEQAVWAFPRSLTRHLLSEREDQEDYARDCRERLRPDLAEDLIVARHKPTRALYEVTCAISEFPFNDAERRITGIDASTTVLCDSLGSNERLATSPVPRFYTRHTRRFLKFWLTLVPLGLWAPFENTWNHSGCIFATLVLSGFLLGIEELSIQLEEPFSLLPQHGITNNSIGKVLTEMVENRARDYERKVEGLNRDRENGSFQ